VQPGERVLLIMHDTPSSPRYKLREILERELQRSG
jgi:hypothetical protein